MTLTAFILSLFVSQANPPDLDRVLACHIVQGASMGIGTIIGIETQVINHVSKKLFDDCLKNGPEGPLAHLEKTISVFHSQQLKSDWCIFNAGAKYKKSLSTSDFIPDKFIDEIRVCIKNDHH